MTRLAERGLPVVQFGQGLRDMTGPCKEIERAILARKFRHGGNRVLRWNFANVRPETDAARNIKFSKAKSSEKIDGAVAAAMAVAVALTDDEASGDQSMRSVGCLLYDGVHNLSIRYRLFEQRVLIVTGPHA